MLSREVGKRDATVLHPIAQVAQATLGLDVADDLAGLDQDMAGLVLDDHHWLASDATQFAQLDDVKPVGAAHDGAGLADLELAQHLEEQAGHAVAVTPAQVAALESVAGLRESRRDFGEVLAGLQCC